MERLVEFIHKETGLEEDLIRAVLMAEERFVLRSILGEEVEVPKRDKYRERVEGEDYYSLD